MKYKISRDILETNIGKELIILELEEGNYLKLNETAAHIWERIKLNTTYDSVVNELKKEFSSYPTVGNDVKLFFEQVKSLKIIKDN